MPNKAPVSGFPEHVVCVGGGVCAGLVVVAPPRAGLTSLLLQSCSGKWQNAGQTGLVAEWLLRGPWWLQAEKVASGMCYSSSDTQSIIWIFPKGCKNQKHRSSFGPSDLNMHPINEGEKIMQEICELAQLSVGKDRSEEGKILLYM